MPRYLYTWIKMQLNAEAQSARLIATPLPLRTSWNASEVQSLLITGVTLLGAPLGPEAGPGPAAGKKQRSAS